MGNHSVKGVIKRGDVEQVKEYFTEEPGQKLHADRFGWTPPHVAIHYHKLEVLKYLLDAEPAGLGLDANHVDNEGSTLLHHALYFSDEHFDIALYLLSSGKQKFSVARDHHGNNSVHIAFRVCSLKQIESLLIYFKGHKDAFSATNKEEKTPLDLLKDRVRGSEESLKIVEELQVHIELKLESPTGSKPGSKAGSVQGTPHGSPRSSVHLEHGSGHAAPAHKGSDHKGPESPSVKKEEKSASTSVPTKVSKEPESPAKKEEGEGKSEDGEGSKAWAKTQASDSGHQARKSGTITISGSDLEGAKEESEDGSDEGKKHKKKHHHHHKNHDHHHHHHHKKGSEEEEGSKETSTKKKKHSGSDEDKKASSDEEKKK